MIPLFPHAQDLRTTGLQGYVIIGFNLQSRHCWSTTKLLFLFILLSADSCLKSGLFMVTKQLHAGDFRARMLADRLEHCGVLGLSSHQT